MSLKITKITLDDYRGYKHFSIEDISDLVIIVGPNAVGKTNIIEAIQLLTTATSFKKPSWSETISWGRLAASAAIEMQEGKRKLEHRVHIVDNERKYEINKKKKGTSSIRGTLPCVLFIPDDLQLIKTSSVKRRDAIDTLAVQLSKNYSTLKNEYQQVLKQRNLLIKEGIHEGSLFDSWDESLCIYGARLCLNRWRLFDRLLEHMQAIYKTVVPGEQLQALYIPSWKRFDESGRQMNDIPQVEEESGSAQNSLESIEEALRAASHDLSEQEVRRGVSLIGPHKDEISFFINGRNARLFASQGQQRTIVLTLKLAAVKMVQEIMGVEPILLLDDVMSELDSAHRSELMHCIEQGSQTFITTTNLEYFPDEILKRATIVRVPIEGTRYEY